MTMEDYDIKSFSFDTDRFLNSFFHQLVTILRTHQLVFDGIDQYKPTEWNLRKQIYFDIFMTAFMQQLFEQIQLDFYASFTFDIQNIRYCASISNSRVNVDYGKGYDYDPMTAYEDEDTPIITLKRKLLSALTKTKDISSSLSSPMHSFLVQVLDKNAFPTKDSILKKELPGRMSAVFQSIGMIERETSETRFFWRIFPVDFEYIDLGVPYFSLQHYSVNQARSYGDNRLNMLVFDLAHDSLDMSRNREIEPCCRVYMPDIDGMINCRNRFQVYQLKYDAFCNDTSISSYINGNIILKDIQEGEFTVYALLRFIGTETDFLKSKKLRDYIRTDVDLADPQRRHTIGDLFLEHNSEVVIKMHFRTASLHLMKTIQHAIRLFARKTVTTYHIQRFLLIPWIKYVLTPAVLNAQNLFLKSNRDRKYAMFYFVFTEPLIETAFGGRRSFEYDMNETCSEYMIRELRNEIDSRIALFSHVTVRFLPNAQVNRHFGCLIEGARFSSSLTGKPQLINRISRRSYAIHFLNHYVKKTAIVSEKIKKEGEQIVDTKDGIKNADNKGNGQKKDDGKEEKQSEKTIISIDLQDSLTLYPLVEKDAFLNSILNKRLDNTEFYVKNECSVAAGM
jgi:hypothetical protein